MRLGVPRQERSGCESRGDRGYRWHRTTSRGHADAGKAKAPDRQERRPSPPAAVRASTGEDRSNGARRRLLRITVRMRTMIGGSSRPPEGAAKFQIAIASGLGLLRKYTRRLPLGIWMVARSGFMSMTSPPAISGTSPIQ